MMIMKKTTQYIAMASLTFSLAACTQDDILQGFNDPNAVRINATIGHLQSRVTYEASGATFFSAGDAIKVENTKRTTKNIATYTMIEGSGWTTQDAFVWNSGTEANNQFQAWYPATASFDSFDLPVDQTAEAKLAAADWMTASTAAMAKPEDGVLNLNFEHKLAKVTVNISSEYGAEYDVAPKITDVKIYTYDGGKEITPLPGTNNYTAIVTPGNAYTTATFMTLKANDVALIVKPTTTLTAEGGLAAGSHYTFTLKVGKDAATISEVTVGEWNTETIPGGEAVEKDYNESTNTYIVRTTDALNTAISNAGTSGTTDNPAIIKLTADVEVAGTPDESGTYEPAFLVDKGVIALDLNGRTITFTDKPFYAIRVNNGATLTINDSSERKQGKIANAKYVLDLRDGKLVINGGTFEGEYAVEGWDENCIIEINGGTFIATKDAVYAQNSFLTITGGTFTGNRYALSLNSSGIFSFTGGSFYGKQYDVGTAGQVGFLSYNQETGTGPTFPGGLSIYTTEYLGFNLNALLAEGAAYYDANGTKIELDDSAASCNGDVTVKKVTE